jgi:hypothetical protein
LVGAAVVADAVVRKLDTDVAIATRASGVPHVATQPYFSSLPLPCSEKMYKCVEIETHQSYFPYQSDYPSFCSH